MSTIYTISSFVTKNIPPPNSIEWVVLENFYMFKVYHKSKEMIKLYMDYIDANFDCAFSKLGLRIISYDYPDTITYSCGYMCDWINKHYQLENDNLLDVNNELIIGTGYNDILGDITVMLNSITSFDIMEYYGQNGSIGIFEEEGAIAKLIRISQCLMDDSDADIIKNIALSIAKYSKSAIAVGYGCYDMHDAKTIDETYMALYCQKAFIKREMGC